MDGLVQIWTCEKCGTERIYGNAPQPELGYRTALLRCENLCSGEHYSFRATQALAISRWDESSTNVSKHSVELIPVAPRMEARFVHVPHKYTRTEFRSRPVSALENYATLRN